MPAAIYLAFAPYGTSNGAAFIASAQVPATVNSNGNVDATEYARFPLVCRGDCNCDRTISWRDIDYFVAALTSQSAWESMFLPTSPGCPFSNNDANGDGAVSWRDIDPFVGLMNTTCQ